MYSGAIGSSWLLRLSRENDELRLLTSEILLPLWHLFCFPVFLYCSYLFIKNYRYIIIYEPFKLVFWSEIFGLWWFLHLIVSCTIFLVTWEVDDWAGCLCYWCPFREAWLPIWHKLLLMWLVVCLRMENQFGFLCLLYRFRRSVELFPMCLFPRAPF